MLLAHITLQLMFTEMTIAFLFFSAILTLSELEQFGLFLILVLLKMSVVTGDQHR